MKTTLTRADSPSDEHKQHGQLFDFLPSPSRAQPPLQHPVHPIQSLEAMELVLGEISHRLSGIQSSVEVVRQDLAYQKADFSRDGDMLRRSSMSTDSSQLEGFPSPSPSCMSDSIGPAQPVPLPKSLPTGDMATRRWAIPSWEQTPTKRQPCRHESASPVRLSRSVSDPRRPKSRRYARHGHGRDSIPIPSDEHPFAQGDIVDWDGFFQGGDKKYKHHIVEYKFGPQCDKYRPDGFYYLECKEHGMHFNADPLRGAMAHCKKHEGMRDASYEAVILEFGVLILGCSKDRQKHNNDIFEKALGNGYIPLGTRVRDSLVPLTTRRRSRAWQALMTSTGAGGSGTAGPQPDKVAIPRKQSIPPALVPAATPATDKLPPIWSLGLPARAD